MILLSSQASTENEQQRKKSFISGNGMENQKAEDDDVYDDGISKQKIHSSSLMLFVNLWITMNMKRYQFHMTIKLFKRIKVGHIVLVHF